MLDDFVLELEELQRRLQERIKEQKKSTTGKLLDWYWWNIDYGL